MENKYKRNCPKCNCEIVYSGKWAKYHYQNGLSKKTTCTKCYDRSGNKNPFFGKHHPEETRRQIALFQIGSKKSTEAKNKISVFQKKRYSDPDECQRTSELTKTAMHQPEIREKHIKALHHSKWIKVRTDKGQLELLEKWNRLGFHFEPNYQVHTDEDLFYLDGYDKERNVVLEYDSRYHKKSYQKERDVIRQNKIIDILRPRKFWRYDAEKNQVMNVLGKEG